MGGRAPLLEVRAVRRSFDGVRALAGVSFTIREGELVGIIGPNGAGKTTLFNVIGGFLTPDAGEVRFRGERITSLPPYLIRRRGVVRTFQEVRLAEDLTALENVLLWFPAGPGEGAWQAVFARRAWRREEERRTESARALLAELGLEQQATRLAGELSYGQQKLVTIACCRAAQPRLLLMDEPVAGVAPQLVEAIMDAIVRLAREGIGILLVEHDVDTIFRRCPRVLFMDQGRVLVDAPPDVVAADPRVVEAYLG